MVNVTELKLPDYHFREGEPDYEKLGEKLRKHVRKYHSGTHVVRAVSLQGRPNNQSLDDLVRVVENHGTDRDSSEIKGEGYHKHKDIEFFAGVVDSEGNNNLARQYFEPFYKKLVERKAEPRRVDLLILYDENHVEIVPHKTASGKERNDGYKFKNAHDKKAAVKGMIKITY